jgi:hypothetical protein
VVVLASKPLLTSYQAIHTGLADKIKKNIANKGDPILESMDQSPLVLLTMSSSQFLNEQGRNLCVATESAAISVPSNFWEFKAVNFEDLMNIVVPNTDEEPPSYPLKLKDKELAKLHECLNSASRHQDNHRTLVGKLRTTETERQGTTAPASEKVTLFRRSLRALTGKRREKDKGSIKS